MVNYYGLIKIRPYSHCLEPTLVELAVRPLALRMRAGVGGKLNAYIKPTP